MRITTSMVMRNYKSNLNSSLIDLDKTRTQVETGRRISASYEDPSAAAQGSILEERYTRNQDYQNSANNAQSWLYTQESVITELNSIAVTVSENYAQAAVSDTSGTTGRQAYAASIREMQKSMIYSLNTKYGNSYVMAGSDGANPPFSLDDDGNVLYRGINVTTGEGDGITADDGLALLEKYAGESSYIDLGFGLTFDGKGDVVSSSALDTALPGISVTGYGTDEDGLSNNMLTIMGEMADLLEEDVFNEDKFDALWSKLKDQVSGLQDQFTGLGTKTQLLTTTISRLETEQTNIESRYEDTIGIDSAEAITDYSYASYVYNAALKVGTTILTQSLLDYLN